MVGIRIENSVCSTSLDVSTYAAPLINVKAHDNRTHLRVTWRPKMHTWGQQNVPQDEIQPHTVPCQLYTEVRQVHHLARQSASLETAKRSTG